MIVALGTVFLPRLHTIDGSQFGAVRTSRYLTSAIDVRVNQALAREEYAPSICCSANPEMFTITGGGYISVGAPLAIGVKNIRD
jgi:hypothetical protein